MVLFAAEAKAIWMKLRSPLMCSQQMKLFDYINHMTMLLAIKLVALKYIEPFLILLV